jgi:ADP-heptose:LPS heptosyltransferase
MSPGSQPSFKDRTKNASRLLVVDFGFLGDSVQLIPTLWELRRHHPTADLHVLTTRVGGEVLRMAPCVDRVWDLELIPDRRTLREQLRILGGLRRSRFDVAFNFSGSDRTVFWTWFSGARLRAAAAWGKHHFWTRWIIPDLAAPQDPDLPVAQQRRGVLAELGFDSGPLRYELTPPPSARQRAIALVPERALHLSVNAAKPLKEWPLEHCIDLARHLLDQLPSLRIVASASSRKREQQRLLQLGAGVNSPNLKLLPPDLTIPELTAVLQRCRMHVGPDSGVMNLAAAIGIPTISFFRDQPGYKSWLPAGRLHQAFVGSCHCVDHGEAPCLPSGRAECLGAITPQTVLTAILQRLPDFSPGIIP